MKPCLACGEGQLIPCVIRIKGLPQYFSTCDHCGSELCDYIESRLNIRVITPMSYDIYLVDENKDTIQFDQPHQLKGGTYALGGTTDAHLNITYNYGVHYRRIFGPDGIRTLYGKLAKDTIPMLMAGIAALGDDVDPDYWTPTEGNAKKALQNLLTLAQMAPEGRWDGD